MKKLAKVGGTIPLVQRRVKYGGRAGDQCNEPARNRNFYLYEVRSSPPCAETQGDESVKNEKTVKVSELEVRVAWLLLSPSAITPSPPSPVPNLRSVCASLEFPSGFATASRSTAELH